MTLNLAALADEIDLVVNIAPGKNYLALSSDELHRASRSAHPEASRNVLQDLANQRAYELCAARGYNRVASAPTLKDAPLDAAIGPWADDFAGMADTVDVHAAYAEVTLEVGHVPHKVFSKLKCGMAFVEPLQVIRLDHLQHNPFFLAR